jgi:hypothetical protein
MPPIFIALGVAAVWAYLKGTTQLNTLPKYLFGVGSGIGNPTDIKQPAITNDPSTVAPPGGPVTNQPGTSGSGVPASAAQVQPYQNPIPGYSVAPGVSAADPFFGYASSLFTPSPIGRVGPSPNGKGGGCGCGGSGGGGGCSGGCGGCGRSDGRGACQKGTTAAPNTPPTTKVGYIRNMETVPSANTFQLFQTNVYDAENEYLGNVPAGPSYHR